MAAVGDNRRIYFITSFGVAASECGRHNDRCNTAKVTDDSDCGDGDSDGIEGDGDDSKEHKARNDGDIGQSDDGKLTMRYYILTRAVEKRFARPNNTHRRRNCEEGYSEELSACQPGNGDDATTTATVRSNSNGDARVTRMTYTIVVFLWGGFELL
ncbi:hypothetical protein QTP88_005898 [Uroleucon formosanum]